MGLLETRLEQAAKTSEGERIVVFRCPLALADRVKGRLGRRPVPVLVITTDLEDPLPAWRETREGRRLGNHPLRWCAMAELAAQSAPVRQAMKRDTRSLRRFLPTKMALQSPRLAPALAHMTTALPRLRQNQDNWTLRQDRALLLTLYAFNAATHEGLQLRVTPDALDRWPALEPDSRAPGKYAVSWTLKPEEVPELAGLF
jgi:hypothetical protein